MVALDLLLRCPDLVSGAILIEPPLLAFVPGATEGLSADRVAIEEALREGGPARRSTSTSAGGCPSSAPAPSGSRRRSPRPARERPLSLFAELGAVPSWSLRPAEMRRGRGADPDRRLGVDARRRLRAAAAELRTRLAGQRDRRGRRRGAAPAHGAADLAALIAEI